jgi:predicted PurR-regulated permease PerM
MGELTGRGRVLLFAALIAGLAILALCWHWVDTIPLGIAVAVVLAPLHHRLSAQVPGWLSALAITLVILAVTIAGVFFTVTIMGGNLATNEEILMKAAGGIEILASQFTGFGIPRETIGEVMDVIRATVEAVGSFWSGITMVSAIMNERFLLFLVALFLSLWQGDRVLRRILVRIPREWLGTWHRLATVSVDTLNAVLVVHLPMVALTFFLCLPFYLVLGYGHVLYLSTATALCELVPVLGASIPMIILLFYTFAIGDIRGFLLVLFIGYLVIALLPELTLRPILMGRRTHISPVVMFFGFMGGILLLGIPGFLLGPLILAVAVSWWQLRKERAAGTPEKPP